MPRQTQSHPHARARTFCPPTYPRDRVSTLLTHAHLSHRYISVSHTPAGRASAGSNVGEVRERERETERRREGKREDRTPKPSPRLSVSLRAALPRRAPTTNGIASPGRCLRHRPTWQLFVLLARRRTQCGGDPLRTSLVDTPVFSYCSTAVHCHGLLGRLRLASAVRRHRRRRRRKFHDAVTHVIRREERWTATR